MFCLHNEPHFGRLLFIYFVYPPYLLLSLSLKFLQLGLIGHSFFPSFYLIVFEKGLVAHPEPDGRAMVCLQHGSNTGRVSEGWRDHVLLTGEMN